MKLCDFVWGHDADVSESAFSGVQNAARSVLEAARVPWTYGKVRGEDWIIKKDA
jgi:hypothetical protein